MDRKARGIDEIIQQAMRAGAFDNLPGKGKPLDLNENPYLDPEWQLAYHLLKQNGFAPQFIEQRQAIEIELASAREALARTWAWCTRELRAGKPADWVEAEWSKTKAKFEEEVLALNRRIRDYNLQVPAASLHRHLIDLHQEIQDTSK